MACIGADEGTPDPSKTLRAEADAAALSAAKAEPSPLAQAQPSHTAAQKCQVRGANQGREIKEANDMVTS